MTRTYQDGYDDARRDLARRLHDVIRWEHAVQGHLIVSSTTTEGAWMWAADALAVLESTEQPGVESTPEEQDTCQ